MITIAYISIIWTQQGLKRIYDCKLQTWGSLFSMEPLQWLEKHNVKSNGRKGRLKYKFHSLGYYCSCYSSFHLNNSLDLTGYSSHCLSPVRIWCLRVLDQFLNCWMDLCYEDSVQIEFKLSMTSLRLILDQFDITQNLIKKDIPVTLVY